MKRGLRNATARRQEGWVGLVVLLLALVIVAVLAKDALQKYGLTAGLGNTGPASKATPVGEAPQDLSVAPAPGNALERARGLEGSVKEQAQDLSRRIDDASTTK